MDHITPRCFWVFLLIERFQRDNLEIKTFCCNLWKNPENEQQSSKINAQENRTCVLGVFNVQIKALLSTQYSSFLRLSLFRVACQFYTCTWTYTWSLGEHFWLVMWFNWVKLQQRDGHVISKVNLKLMIPLNLSEKLFRTNLEGGL